MPGLKFPPLVPVQKQGWRGSAVKTTRPSPSCLEALLRLNRMTADTSHLC